MPYTNFKGDVWAKAIERIRDRYCVGAMLCNRDYEKEAVEFGKNIVIAFTKRPTVKSYTPGSSIDNAETLDHPMYMNLSVNQMKYVNFMVDDIDELQSRPNIMESCMLEAASAIAQDADDFVYKMYDAASTSITQANVTSHNITEIISNAALALYKANVPMNEELSLEVSPEIYQKLWLAKMLRSTSNEKELGTGFVGMFDNFKIYLSNGIVKDTSGNHCCIARTRKAISFVGQMQKMEAYRPTGYFADAVKGLHVYGAVATRPTEMVSLKLKPTAEPV